MAVTIENWENYVQESKELCDPLGYLTAVNDIVGSLVALSKDQSPEEVSRRLQDFIAEYEAFSEFGWQYMKEHYSSIVGADRPATR